MIKYCMKFLEGLKKGRSHMQEMIVSYRFHR